MSSSGASTPRSANTARAASTIRRRLAWASVRSPVGLSAGWATVERGTGTSLAETGEYSPNTVCFSPSRGPSPLDAFLWSIPMRAIAMTHFGAAPALINLPRPEPADGEVLVRVQASSVNGFDGSVAAGHLQGMMEHRFPVILGKDFAGIVESVGPGASRFTVGVPVFGVVMK